MRLNDDCERNAGRADGDREDVFADVRRRRGACIGTAFCIRTETANPVCPHNLRMSYRGTPITGRRFRNHLRVYNSSSCRKNSG